MQSPLKKEVAVPAGATEAIMCSMYTGEQHKMQASIHTIRKKEYTGVREAPWQVKAKL